MRHVILIATLCVAASPALAQMHGVAVQVSQGQPVPSVAQLRTLITPGGFVRDLVPWSKTDPNCNLATDPSAGIVILDPLRQLYDNVAAAGGKNFATLGFNNAACGQASAYGWTGFPNTPALRAEFAAYAVQVVQSVPSLGGISIWNEMNGSFNGGYGGPGSIAAKLAAYCLLANDVITAVRKVNKDIPIAVGASVGWNIQGWFVKLFTRYGCLGGNDPSIWLDVHPYISGVWSATTVTGWTHWTKSIAYIRNHGVNNKLIATEWGGPAAAKWSLQVPGGSYPQEFQNRILATDSGWAALMWFEAMHDTNIPNVGLFDASGTSLTPMGQQYVAVFIP
jgi:hypothetical protein